MGKDKKDKERKAPRSVDGPNSGSERSKDKKHRDQDEHMDRKRDKDRDGDRKSKKSKKESDKGIGLEDIRRKPREKEKSSKSRNRDRDRDKTTDKVLESVDSPLSRNRRRPPRPLETDTQGDEEKGSHQGSFGQEEPVEAFEDKNGNFDIEAGEGGKEGDEEEEEEEHPKRDFGTSCKECLIRYLGPTATNFLVRKRFVLYRLFLCVAYYAIGVEFYHFWEGWSRSDCIYFITVSTTTVGYGDLHPTDDDSRLFTTFYVMFGIIVVLDSANQVIQYFIVKKTQRYILLCIDACVRFYYRNFRGYLSEDGGDDGGTSLNTTSWFKIGFSVLLVLGMIGGGTSLLIASICLYSLSLYPLII